MKRFFCYLSIAFALAACATSNEKPALEKIEDLDTDEKVLPPEFLEAFKSSANESCLLSGSNLDDCNCYTDEIISTFNANDFSKVFELAQTTNDLNTVISDPDVGPKIVNASMKCFYKD